jgi:hypothetical protein
VKEYAIAMGMVNAVRQHDVAMRILFDGTTLEHGIDWSIGVRSCKSTPDSFAKTWSSDLKSARCTEPRWIAREALRRHYHAQLAFYDDAIDHETKHRPDEAYLVCVENVAPYNVTILRLPDATREVGAKLCGGWWQRLQLAEATETYGGYVEQPIDLALPEWEIETMPADVEVDGSIVHLEGLPS